MRKIHIKDFVRGWLTALSLCLLTQTALAEWAPPTEVARISALEGQAVVNQSGSKEWFDVELNRPVTSGDQLWIEEGSRTELQCGVSTVWIGPKSEVHVLTLEEHYTHLKLTEGSLAIRVRQLDKDANIEVSTPNLLFVVTAPGEYRFDVDDDNLLTTVTVTKGRGAAYGEGDQYQALRAKQQARFNGVDLHPVGDISYPSSYDYFDQWVAQRNRLEDRSTSTRYVSRYMTGYQDLDDNGVWEDDDQYGAVWVPRITVSNWAPYRYGHWAWVEPWGWTWIDDTSWGFATSHYGRWVYHRDRWAWTPGQHVPRPIYAPALVGFVGWMPRDVHEHRPSTSVGWYPLGPNESYQPSYTRDSSYINRLNQNLISNKKTIDTPIDSNRTSRAITTLPHSDFVAGKPATQTTNSPQQPRQEISEPNRPTRTFIPGRILNRIPNTQIPMQHQQPDEPRPVITRPTLPEQQEKPVQIITTPVTPPKSQNRDIPADPFHLDHRNREIPINKGETPEAPPDRQRVWPRVSMPQAPSPVVPSGSDNRPPEQRQIPPQFPRPAVPSESNNRPPEQRQIPPQMPRPNEGNGSPEPRRMAPPERHESMPPQNMRVDPPKATEQQQREHKLQKEKNRQEGHPES